LKPTHFVLFSYSSISPVERVGYCIIQDILSEVTSSGEFHDLQVGGSRLPLVGIRIVPLLLPVLQTTVSNTQ